MNKINMIGRRGMNGGGRKKIKMWRNFLNGNSIAFAMAIILAMSGLFFVETPTATAAVPAQCRQIAKLLQSNKLRKANRAASNSKECGYLVATVLYRTIKEQGYPDRRVALIKKLFRWSKQKLSHSSPGYPDYLEGLIRVGFDSRIGIDIRKKERLSEFKSLIDDRRYKKFEQEIEGPYLVQIQRNPFNVNCSSSDSFSQRIVAMRKDICLKIANVRRDCGAGNAGLQVDRLRRCHEAIEGASNLSGIEKFRKNLKIHVATLYARVQRQTRTARGQRQKMACKKLGAVAGLGKKLNMSIGSGGKPPQCQAMVSAALSKIEDSLPANDFDEEDNDPDAVIRTVQGAFSRRPFREYYRSCVRKLPDVRNALGEDRDEILTDPDTGVKDYIRKCARAFTKLRSSFGRNGKLWIKLPALEPPPQYGAGQVNRQLNWRDIRIGLLLTNDFKRALPKLSRHLQEEASFFATVLSHRLRTFRMATRCIEGQRQGSGTINKILRWSTAHNKINGAKVYLNEIIERARSALTREAYDLALEQFEVSFQRWKTCGQDGGAAPVGEARGGAAGARVRGRGRGRGRGRARARREPADQRGYYTGREQVRSPRRARRRVIPPAMKPSGQANYGERPTFLRPGPRGDAIAATLDSFCRKLGRLNRSAQGLQNDEAGYGATTSVDAEIAATFSNICKLRSVQATGGRLERRAAGRLLDTLGEVKGLIDDLLDR